jgi:hypothetical protein
MLHPNLLWPVLTNEKQTRIFNHENYSIAIYNLRQDLPGSPSFGDLAKGERLRRHRHVWRRTKLLEVLIQEKIKNLPLRKREDRHPVL